MKKYLYYFESVPGSSLFFTFYLSRFHLIAYNASKPFTSLKDLHLAALDGKFDGLVKLSHQQHSGVPGMQPKSVAAGEKE